MRALCYNIRHGQGVGGVLSNARIGRLISRARCDCVALTEVWRIAGAYDQPAMLSGSTGMEPSYNAVSRTAGVELGNLVLTATPVRSVRTIDLGRRRGCAVVETGEDHERFAFAATHLSLDRRVRRDQIEVLAATLPRDVPLVIAGDFNCGASELDPLREFLCFPEDVPRTFPSIAPMRVLDHIGFSRQWRLESLEVIPSWASDHLPLLAELNLVG